MFLRLVNNTTCHLICFLQPSFKSGTHNKHNACQTQPPLHTPPTQLVEREAHATATCVVRSQQLQPHDCTCHAVYSCVHVNVHSNCSHTIVSVRAVYFMCMLSQLQPHSCIGIVTSRKVLSHATRDNGQAVYLMCMSRYISASSCLPLPIDSWGSGLLRAHFSKSSNPTCAGHSSTQVTNRGHVGDHPVARALV